MLPRLLFLEEYNKHFNLEEPDTGCGIETDNETGDNYFFIQIFLPKSFFNISPLTFLGNPLVNENNIPNDILVKLELFGIGEVGGV